MIFPPIEGQSEADYLLDEEKPREKLDRNGEGSLTDSELLALILGTGYAGQGVMTMSRRLLADYGSLKQVLAADRSDLASRPGMGKAKVCRIKAMLEAARRLGTLAPSKSLRGPEDVNELLASRIRYGDRETFAVVCLDTRQRVLRVQTISIGSLDSALVHPREAFRPAVSAGAWGVIFAHNHPSGDPSPSTEDLAVTRRLIKAGGTLGIKVLDHLVVGDAGWVSLRESTACWDDSSR